jgi:hypothetical protein
MHIGIVGAATTEVLSCSVIRENGTEKLVTEIFDVSVRIFGTCLYVYHHHRMRELYFSMLPTV